MAMTAVQKLGAFQNDHDILGCVCVCVCGVAFVVVAVVCIEMMEKKLLVTTAAPLYEENPKWCPCRSSAGLERQELQYHKSSKQERARCFPW
jgi:hypothetical protein